MKNKVELKRMLIISTFTIILYLIIVLMCYTYQYNKYTYEFNKKINNIIAKVLNQNPGLDKNDIMTILNEKEDINDEALKQYGIDLSRDSIILKNDIYFSIFCIINIILLSIFAINLIFIFWCYNKKKDNTLNNITNYIEQINQKNYNLDIDDNTEDELSILKNEIYKTTIMLKEIAENSRKQEINLKNSLEDISHQLKTPLTSTMIMLDNILDTPDMDKNTREEFIKDCKKEIINVHLLVQDLLKLSRFDAGTIEYKMQKVNIKDLLNEAIRRVSVLCDLKNVNIQLKEDGDNTINCDFRWQVEAITNLLKNAVEYSKDFSKIDIRYFKNKLYTQVEIQDYGKGIDEGDIKHLFERFYKGKNSTRDSVGIGLALSKTIIEKNNGKIYVQSEIGKGSTFIIRYFKC